jgi:uroporphyrinogen-III synthase
MGEGPRRVWVTRDEPQDGELGRALRDVGLDPVWCPVLMRRLRPEVIETLRDLHAGDWLVLTSRYAIEAIPAGFVKSRVAVVGQASADAAKAKGWRVERESPDGTGRGLWDSLRSDLAGARRLCYPRSSLAPMPDTIPGVEMSAPILYETAPRPFDLMAARSVDVVSVCSPSAAEAISSVPKLPRAAALGPTTAAALRRLGIDPWLEVRNATFEDYAAGIAERVRIDQNAAISPP